MLLTESRGRLRGQNLPDRVLNTIHENVAFKRRIRRLSRAVESILPSDVKTVLDVGAGSGEIAQILQQSRPTLQIQGLDILVRPNTPIPVQSFNGIQIPFPARSFDVVLLIDVLHHAHQPVTLLQECRRVATQGVVLKDHVAAGRLDRTILYVMDWFGNAARGVRMECQYFSEKEWQEAFERTHLVPETELRQLDLYPFPFSLLLERHLHFVSFLRPSE